MKFSDKWMELDKIIILNEEMQTPNDKYGMYPFIC